MCTNAGNGKTGNDSLLLNIYEMLGMASYYMHGNDGSVLCYMCGNASNGSSLCV
jgi:hypothetical protein